MKRITIIVFLIFFLNPVSSICQKTKGINKDFENLSGQCAECAAYFRLVYHAMISSNENDTAKSYRELEDMVMFYSLLLANQGRDRVNVIELFLIFFR